MNNKNNIISNKKKEELKKEEELADEYTELKDTSWENALNIMCGPLVRDENGNNVTDPEILKIVNDAMKDINRFECGGEFKKIQNEKVKNRNKNLRKKR
jgi:hypothetical protein